MPLNISIYKEYYSPLKHYMDFHIEDTSKSLILMQSPITHHYSIV